MIPQISYNVLIDRFRAFAEAHFLIKGFSHGDLSNIDIEKEVEFPWMHVLPVEVEPRAGTRLYSFVIIFADLPRDKETPAEYQRECISDCIKLAEDLLAEVQNGQIVFGPFVELDGGASIEVFINEFSHTLVGVNLQLTLSVPWDWSACDIPADFTIGGSGSGGEGVAVGITLQTNGVNNGLQSLLNLQQGTNVTIVDNGNGTVTINSTGGGGGGGTVTSVALTVPSAFAVSGSPITGAGTIAITGAGTSGDYIDGTGALQTFPAIPTAQGLQDVITTDPVLTADNTIDCNTFELTIDGTSNFTVNSTSKVDINVSSDAALGIDSNSISIGKATGTTQTQVLTDTTKAAISASESASANETSLTLFPNSARLKTPNVNDATATVGQVLTLSNAGTGEVEFTTAGVGTVTSVGLTMPSAFTVAGSPVTTAGTLAVTGAGLASQYVRGDGTLANFPTGGGGGASVNYYLNGSVSQGTIGGATFRQLSKTAIIGTGTDFVRTNGAGNGYIAQFITDINDPAQLLIPSGNWHFETFFSASSNGGNPSFYIQLYKYDGSTLTLIASNAANPEGITAGTVIDLYTSVISVPATVLTASDRIAIRIYVNTSGRTLTLHTEGPHLSEITTTFSTGITAINSLTAQVQSLTTGTAGTDFAINSAGSVHTFNLPTASAANRGALSSADWSTFNGKQNSIGLTTVGTNLATLPNPSAVRYLRINADNTVAALTLAELKTDLSLGSDISVVLGSNVVNVGTTFEDVTGLSFAVTAGKTYKWRATISFGIPSGTYLFSSNGPATTINNARFTMATGLTANGVSNQTAYDAGANVTGTSNGLCTADGIVKVSASGTWTVRFRCSIAGNLTVRAGSVLEYSEVL